MHVWPAAIAAAAASLSLSAALVSSEIPPPARRPIPINCLSAREQQATPPPQPPPDRPPGPVMRCYQRRFRISWPPLGCCCCCEQPPATTSSGDGLCDVPVSGSPVAGPAADSGGRVWDQADAYAHCGRCTRPGHHGFGSVLVAESSLWTWPPPPP